MNPIWHRRYLQFGWFTQIVSERVIYLACCCCCCCCCFPLLSRGFMPVELSPSSTPIGIVVVVVVVARTVIPAINDRGRVDAVSTAIQSYPLIWLFPLGYQILGHIYTHILMERFQIIQLHTIEFALMLFLERITGFIFFSRDICFLLFLFQLGLYMVERR